MRALAGPRFGVEATIIVAVAVLAGLLELPLIAIVGAVFGAWIVVALAELTVSRRAATLPPQPAAAERAAEPPNDRPALAAVPEPEVKSVSVPVSEAVTDWEADAEPAAEHEPRAWNVWELERRLQSRPDSAERGELAYLLLYLRDYANPDGDLPIEFDPLVRESFGDLVAADR